MSRAFSPRRLSFVLWLFFACLNYSARADNSMVSSTGSAWKLDAATYAGGAGADNANAMALGSDGALYVAINSTIAPEENARDLRVDKAKTNASADIVLRKYRAGGTDLEWTLLLGGAGDDTAHGLVLGSRQ